MLLWLCPRGRLLSRTDHVPCMSGRARLLGSDTVSSGVQGPRWHMETGELPRGGRGTVCVLCSRPRLILTAGSGARPAPEEIGLRRGRVGSPRQSWTPNWCSASKASSSLRPCPPGPHAGLTSCSELLTEDCFSPSFRREWSAPHQGQTPGDPARVGLRWQGRGPQGSGSLPLLASLSFAVSLREVLSMW